MWLMSDALERQDARTHVHGYPSHGTTPTGVNAEKMAAVSNVAHL